MFCIYFSGFAISNQQISVVGPNCWFPCYVSGPARSRINPATFSTNCSNIPHAKQNFSKECFTEKVFYRKCFTHRRTRRGVGEGCRPPSVWKILGQTLLSGQAQLAQKSWMTKNISIQWTISGQTLFSGQAQVAENSWMMKNISIQRKISGKTLFSGKAQVAQKSWMIKNIFITVKNFRAILFFRASASCSKILIDEK